MVTIYKYHFQIADKVEVEMPFGADVLSIQFQNGTPTMWAKVETTQHLQKRIFRMYGTGHELDLFAMEGRYLATLQQDGFVFHIFD